MENIQMKAVELFEKLTSVAVNGAGPLISAEKLAKQYLEDSKYKDNDERAKELVKWESSKNFTTGFLTNIGGLITLPVSIPAGVGSSWIVQARMIAAVAKIYGYDIHDDKIQTFILLVLLGDGAKEILKETGVNVGEKIAVNLIKKIPGEIIIEINKKVGFRLLTKAGEKGAINLIKIVPFVGGLIGGTIDGTSCFLVGQTAIGVLKREIEDAENDIEAEIIN